jgi:hypothetical protein
MPYTQIAGIFKLYPVMFSACRPRMGLARGGEDVLFLDLGSRH